MTYKEFLEKAREVHGDKYTYIPWEGDVKKRSNIKIICKEHGEFEQIMHDHLYGHGCRKCADIRISDEEFLNRVRKVHGDSLILDKTKYVDAETKVICTCPEHGDFLIHPKLLTKRGNGCPYCEFLYDTKHTKHHSSFWALPSNEMKIKCLIQKLRKIHGDKYDYSLIKSCDSRSDKIEVICSEHGVFKIQIDSHMLGRGCHKCSGFKKITQEEFEERVRSVHGNNLDLSKAVYKSKGIKVTVICPEHGEFRITPESIWNGTGCPVCQFMTKTSGQSQSFWKLCSTEQKTMWCVEKFKQIHGNEYDYSLIKEIKASGDYIDIICPKHGVFKQMVMLHLNGRGCPNCAHNELLSQDEFKRRVYEVHGDDIDVSESIYNGLNNYVICKCKKHGEFKINASELFYGRSCPACNFLDQNGARTERFWRDYSPEEKAKWVRVKLQNIHGDKYDFSRITEVNHYKDLVEIGCPKHGFDTYTLGNLLSGRGCRYCNESSLERNLAVRLNEHNIKYEREWNKTWLGLQEVDFCIEEMKIAIECQGIQHFQPIDIFGSEEGFSKTVERDIRKYNRLIEHGYKVLYLMPKEKVDYSYVNSIQEIYTEDTTCRNLDELLQKIREAT